MLTSLAAHLLVRLVEEDVVDARRVLEVHGAVAQLQVVFLTHPGGRSTSSLRPPPAKTTKPGSRVFLAGAAHSHTSAGGGSSCDKAG